MPDSRICGRCHQPFPMRRYSSGKVAYRCPKCKVQEDREYRERRIARGLYYETDAVLEKRANYRKTPSGKAAAIRGARKYASTPRGMASMQARMAVRNEIRNGRMVRKPCEKCGNPKSQAHHHDYSKPLEVQWLCIRHHMMVHGRRVILKEGWRKRA